MTTVYLIRHAYAQGNLDRTFQGRIDGKLTELGYQQLDCLAKRCQILPFDAVYTSPLSRAYETAQAANRFHELPIQIEDGLLEIAGGDWEGRKWEELEQEYPALYQQWKERDPKFCAPNGEVMAHVYERMRNTILHIVEENKNKTICIVSHGCAIITFMTWAHGLMPEQIHEMKICDNTALNKITFDDDGKPTVVWENDLEHLPQKLRTYALSLFEHKERKNTK